MKKTVLHEGLLPTARLTVQICRTGVASGRKLLFLGGSNTDLRLRRLFLSSPLLEHVELVTYEPRGLGRSDAPDGDWSMQDYAADAVAVLDALGWQQAWVLGESFGAMTALELALLAPERLLAIALMSGTSGGAGGSSHRVQDFLGLPPEESARAALRVLDLDNVALEHNNPPLFRQRLEQRMAFERAFLGDAGNAAGYPRLLQARAGLNVYGRLRQMTVPTVVMAGNRDGQAPLPAQQAMATAIPGAGYQTFEGGHGFGFETEQPMRWLMRYWGFL